MEGKPQVPSEVKHPDTPRQICTSGAWAVASRASWDAATMTSRILSSLPCNVEVVVSSVIHQQWEIQILVGHVLSVSH